MDRERVAEIEARAAKATPGPWRHEGRHVMALKVKTVAELPCGHVVHTRVDHRNAEFVAYARQDIPDLLAEVDRLAALVEAQREALKRVSPYIRHQEGCGHYRQLPCDCGRSAAMQQAWDVLAATDRAAAGEGAGS
jgi:hypothetical protein